MIFVLDFWKIDFHPEGGFEAKIVRVQHKEGAMDGDVATVDLAYLDGGSELEVPPSKVRILPLERQPKVLRAGTAWPAALVKGMLVERVGEGPLYHPPGSLAVKGANEDSARIAEMIRANMGDIDDIFVTLDSHHVSEIR